MACGGWGRTPGACLISIISFLLNARFVFGSVPFSEIHRSIFTFSYTPPEGVTHGRPHASPDIPHEKLDMSISSKCASVFVMFLFYENVNWFFFYFGQNELGWKYKMKTEFFRVNRKYRKNYQQNTHCKWRIIVNSIRRIQLYITGESPTGDDTSRRDGIVDMIVFRTSILWVKANGSTKSDVVSGANRLSGWEINRKSIILNLRWRVPGSAAYFRLHWA